MKSLIFDVDGVLIDVRKSFHQSIQKTVQVYLASQLDLFVPDDFISDQDIEHMKLFGGFNDDWDLTAGLLYYLSSLYEQDKREILIKKDLPSFLKELSGEGLQAVIDACPEQRRKFVCHQKSSGDNDQDVLLETHLVKRIFQEIYLGTQAFEQKYGEPSAYYRSSGMVLQEKLIFSAECLEQLNSQGYCLSIATGRERDDVMYSLDKFSLRSYFRYVISISDLNADQKKPNPYSLYHLDDKLKNDFHDQMKHVYIGDQIDDMLMGREAKQNISVLPVGFIYPQNAAKVKALKEAGAEQIFHDQDQLCLWLEEYFGGEQ